MLSTKWFSKKDLYKTQWNLAINGRKELFDSDLNKNKVKLNYHRIGGDGRAQIQTYYGLQNLCIKSQYNRSAV